MPGHLSLWIQAAWLFFTGLVFCHKILKKVVVGLLCQWYNTAISEQDDGAHQKRNACCA